jgi:hypothetical protein
MSTSAEILKSFNVDAAELPSVYLLSESGDGMRRYSGELLQMNLAEWVLRHSAPSMGELTFTAPAGKREPAR